MIVGIVEGQSLKLDTPVLVSDSVNFLTAVFHFSPDWESLPEKWVHFASGGEGCSLQLQEGRITAEMGLNLPAGSWEVYLHGLEEDDSGNVLRRATTETVRLYVQDFAGFEGEGFPDAPPGLVGELERELAAVRMLAEGHAARHGQGGADALKPEDIGAGRVNPNLLDNWYFENPVNQRGQTEYGRGYTIDRWSLITTDGSARVNAGSVSVVSGTDAARLDTVLENVLIGKEVTFSILVSETSGNDSMMIYARIDNTDQAVATQSAFNTGCVSITGKIPANATKMRVRFQSAKTDGATLTVKAAKLELGTQQTLAHQDADGNWVLNEIPDYGEQLQRCQRYQIKLNGTVAVGFAISATQAVFIVPLPTTFRGTPTLTFDGTIRVEGTWGSGDNGKEVTALTYNAYTYNGVKIFATTTGLTAGQGCELACRGTAWILFDANL